MTMFLIKEERMMLFGDGCGHGTTLLEDCSTDIETYYNSLLKIKDIESEYDMILRNRRYGESQKDLLQNVLNVCLQMKQKLML